MSATQYCKRRSKTEKTQILNQLDSSTKKHGRRIYDEAVKEALIILWEAADRICGKRLKAILPYLVDAMERHGHLDLNSDVRNPYSTNTYKREGRIAKPNVFLKIQVLN